ncbi:hypothetical protein ACWPKO_27640 (plasmid) [Coraliomargarita sp. W4R53]
MQMHSDYGLRRTWQIIVDLSCLGLIAAAAWLGVTTYTLISELAAFGKHMEEAGAGFRRTMTEVGDTLGGTLGIGPALRVPFDSASGAGGALERAGQSQQEVIQQLAVTLGVGLAILPILMIVLLWLATRYRFVRRASQAKALVSAGVGIDLLALRALSTQRITAIAKIDADAMGAWRRGDDEIMRKLASLELRSAGIRLGASKDA